MIELSIIVMTYNHVKYIKECLDSVFKQKDLVSYEVIIGNNCSTDGTGDIVKQYKEMYPDKVILFNREKNIGLQQNLKECLKVAKGQYITFCEGDDFWISENRCSKMLSELKKSPNSILCFSDIFLFKNNKLEPHAPLYKTRLTKTLVGADDVLFPVNLVCNWSCCMYKREIIDILPNDFYISGNADWLMNLYALDKHDGVYVNERLSAYRITPNSVWSSKSIEDNAFSIMSVCWKYSKLFDGKYENQFFNFSKARFQKLISTLKQEGNSANNQQNNKTVSDELLLKVLENTNLIITQNHKNKAMLACIIREIRNFVFYQPKYFFRTIKGKFRK